MKAYLIDPTNQTVTQVEHDGSLQDLYAHTRCQCIDAVRINEQGDCVFVDDEGLLNGAGYTHGPFMLTRGERRMPLMGYGLVLGSTIEGESTDPACTLDEVKALVSFPSMRTVIDLAREGKFD